MGQSHANKITLFKDRFQRSARGLENNVGFLCRIFLSVMFEKMLKKTLGKILCFICNMCVIPVGFINPEDKGFLRCTLLLNSYCITP